MYRLSKWLYELGRRNEYDRIKADMMAWLSAEPVRYIDSKNDIQESEAHFKKRLDGWFAAREHIEEYFYNHEQREGDSDL